MSIRAVLTAIVGLLAALVVALQPAVANADAATIVDGPDPGAVFDIAEARVISDRGSGTLQLGVRFHTPLPAVISNAGDRYLLAQVRNAGPDDCGSSRKTGDLTITIREQQGSLTAEVSVVLDPYGQSASLTAPVDVAPDRTALSLAVTDERLKANLPRCFAISGSGGSAYDLTTPVWFDTRIPTPPAPDPTKTACGIPLLDLTGPEEVAWGSTGPVVIKGGESYEHSLAPGATLTMTDVPSGKVFYRHDLTKVELARLANDEEELGFFIDLDPERTPAVVTLTWHQQHGKGEVGTCTATADVASIRGTTPSFYAVGGGSGELIARGKRCWENAGKRVTVTVTAGGRTARFTRRDACGEFRGRTRNVGKLRVGPSGYGTINFGSRGSGSARLTVTVGGKVKLRRTVVSRVRSRPDRLIFEGTDAFVNYCINGGKQLYSYQLRLYCIRPGSYSEAVRFRR